MEHNELIAIALWGWAFVIAGGAVWVTVEMSRSDKRCAKMLEEIQEAATCGVCGLGNIEVAQDPGTFVTYYNCRNCGAEKSSYMGDVIDWHRA